MTDRWMWHRFLTVANVPLQSAISLASAACDTPIYVIVDCAVEVQHGSPGLDGDHVQLKADGEHLSCVEYDRQDDSLRDFPAVSNFAQLADALRAASRASYDFRWVDCMVGALATRDLTGPKELLMCAEMLAPFKPWIVPRL